VSRKENTVNNKNRTNIYLPTTNRSLGTRIGGIIARSLYTSKTQWSDPQITETLEKHASIIPPATCTFDPPSKM
jgi:hypothetical protein